MDAMADCLFCSIIAGDVEADIVHRDDRTLAFRDVNPQAPIHVLVVPTRHIVNAGTVVNDDADDVAALLLVAKTVADAEGIGSEDRGYRLVFNVPMLRTAFRTSTSTFWVGGRSPGHQAERVVV
jgi:histidine triad (HIT) family protein